MKIKKKVKIAVFPVAGIGSRFLPITKSCPKEMLPIIDKPLIQYATDEAIDAGIEMLVFVLGKDKINIPNYYAKSRELERTLEERRNFKALELVTSIIPKYIKCVYLKQDQPLGLGHAVLCSKLVVGNNPFAVILADDVIFSSKSGCLKQMINRYESFNSSIIAVEKIQRELLHKYGVIKGNKINGNDWILSGIIEKPKNINAPSEMGVVGRYILKSSIFKILENTKLGEGGEIQLTDAIANYIEKENVYAYEFKGKRFDCGDKLGFLKATVEYALNHPDLSKEFKNYLKKLNLI